MQADFAEKYETFQQWHWWFLGRERILGALIRREWSQARGRLQPRSLVTIGSGPPKGFAWLRSFVEPGGLVLGLDADPSGALRTRAKRGAEAFHAPGVSFVVGELEHPPVGRESFDVVAALDVLEHLDNDAAALRHASHLVAPGGMLLVTVPACPSLWGEQDRVSHHRRRYTRTSLRKAFEGAGLAAPRISYFNTLLFPAIAGVRWGRRLLRLPPQDRSDFEAGRPGLVNNVLTWVFSSEAHVINRIPTPIGVSLVALWTPKTHLP